MSLFERKTLPDGTPNPKYIDLCDEDQPLAGQKFVCISFVSPEKILKKRENYLFEQFLKQWEFTKSMEKFYDFLHFLSYKYNLNVQDVLNDYTDFVKEEGVKIKASSVEDDYKNFLDKREDELNAKFQRDHSYQTSVRGVKIRGSFSTQDEAELRAKKIREADPNHDIFVGPVGVWMPWDPDAYKTGRVEFMEEELNQLHKEKLKNEAMAKQEFENRLKESKRKAIEENVALARKSGNVLTQTLNDEGELIGVKETVNFEEREVSDVVTTNLRNELLRESAAAAEQQAGSDTA